MERKQFLIHVTGAMGLMPLLVTQIGCDNPYGANEDSSSSDNGTESFSVTSSKDSGHTHNITILLADVDTPPESGKSLTSTSSGSHTHTVTLSKSDFESLASGQEITKTSSNSNGHTHTFSIKVPAG